MKKIDTVIIILIVLLMAGCASFMLPKTFFSKNLEGSQPPAVTAQAQQPLAAGAIIFYSR